jgi:hypothetical protein
MERAIGRALTSEEHVHHIDGDVTNNDPSNLELVTNSEHRGLHSIKQVRDELGRFSA